MAPRLLLFSISSPGPRAVPMPIEKPSVEVTSQGRFRWSQTRLWGFVLCVCGTFAGCTVQATSLAQLPGSKPASKQEDSHQKMVAILAKVADGVTTADRLFLPLTPPRSEMLRSLSRLPGDAIAVERYRLHSMLSIAELNLGNEREAIKHLEVAEKLASDPRNNIPEAKHREVLYRLGVTYMRLAETENCCLKNSPESCIIPFQPAAIHTNRAGAENAIAYFSKSLQKSNGVDQRSRWLMNIAYMTLGEYPDKVPREHLIDFNFQANGDSFPRFKNVAAASGMKAFNSGGTVVVDDFDNDGLNDILTSSWDPREPMRFYKNKGGGEFQDRSGEAGLQGLLGGINMVQADFDNDGDLDVYVLRGGWLGRKGTIPNSLLENDGRGRFKDITFLAGLGEVHYPSHSAGWADYDNDGDLDLFVGNESVYGKPSIEFYLNSPSPSQLFRNEGDGTFTDVATEAGVENLRFAKGVTWGDFNNDRYPDLYVSNFDSPNRLYQNNRDGTFTDVAGKFNVDGPLKSFPVWFWDFNNDGNLDLYVPSYSLRYGNLGPVVQGFMKKTTSLESPKLYQGTSEGEFRERSKDLGLTRALIPMGGNFGDLDNDGFTDFYLGTGYPDYEALIPNVMFRNRNGTSFEDVTYPGGFGHLQKGHGIAFADLDSDGDQEVIAQMGGTYEGDHFRDAIFQNPGFGNHWLKVKLIGTESNRSAIGARIHVVITENGEKRSIYKHVNSGGSFGANPLCQTIGLGKASQIDRIEVYWPTTGVTQTFNSVPMDQRIEITEGKPEFRILDTPIMALRMTRNAERLRMVGK